MPDKKLFEPTVVDRLLQTLQENGYFKGYFKRFFYGHPDVIPADFMPCVSIKKTNTQISQSATQMDQNIFNVEIKLYFNKKDEFGREDNEVTGTRSIEQIVEGMDIATGQYADSSLMGILRHNFTLYTSIVDQEVRINYTDIPYPNDQTIGMATLTFTIKALKEVLPRS